MATNVFDLMATLSLDSSKYEAGLNKAKGIGGMFGNALGTAARVGLTAVTAATGATVAFSTESVKTGADFDKAMSQVYATMGDKANETVEYNGKLMKSSEALRDFAMVQGRTTAFTASETAEALNYMALAGYDTNKAMAMLPTVLNLAAAGNMDLARASDMVTDTETAFNMTTERTALMVDEMAKASSTGNTSVEQLGDAFLVVGGLTQELNGGMVTLADGTQKPIDGIQELEIALTAMANSGVKGSEAGTHMRNVLLKLSDPADKGAKALERMGVDVFDKVSGNMRSLKDIFHDLNDAMEPMTQKERIQAVAALFNTRDIASAEALLNAVSQDWDAIGEEILHASDNGGAAAQMAKKQLDNLAGDVTYFKSALEGAKIVISDALTPVLREFVQYATEGLPKITEAFQKGGFKGAMDAFGQVLSDGLTMIIQKVPDMIDAGLALLEALAKGIADNMPVIIDAAAEVVNILFEHLVQNANGLMPAAVEFIKSILQGIEDSADDIVNIAFTFVTMLLDGIATTVEELYPQIVETLDALLVAINNFFASEENIIKFEKAVSTFFTAIGRALGKALPTLIKMWMYDIPLALFNGLIAGILGLLDGIIAFIIGVVQGLVQAVTDTLGIHSPSTVFEEIGQFIIEGLWNGIASMTEFIVENITNFIAMIVEQFLTFRDSFLENLALFVEAVSTSVINVFETIKTGIVTFIDFIRLNFDEFTAAAKKWLLEFINNVITNITDFITKVRKAFAEFTDIAKKWLFDFINDIIKNVSDFIANTRKAFTDFTKAAKEWLSEFVSTTSKSAADFFADIMKKGVDFIALALEKTAEFVTDIVKKFTDFQNDIKKEAGTFFSDAIKWVGKLKDDFVSNLSKLVDDAKKKWTDFKSNTINILNTIATNMPVWVGKIKDNFTIGFSGMIETALANFEEFRTAVTEGFMGFINDAYTWGQDLMRNFINGINSLINQVRETVNQLAAAIHDLMAFSEPKEGPLSDFHTYAPDMMQLFAQGIKDNTNLVTDQIKDSFNFGNLITETSLGGIGTVSGLSYGTGGGMVQNVTINAPTALDPSETARQLKNANRAFILNMEMA